MIDLLFICYFLTYYQYFCLYYSLEVFLKKILYFTIIIYILVRVWWDIHVSILNMYHMYIIVEI